MEIEDLKLEFAQWLIKQAPVSYKQFLGSEVEKVISRLKEIDNFFPERELFKTNSKDYRDLMNYILFKTNSKERIKNPEFAEYDKFHSNGIPKAVIGKNNYIKFLKEKFENINNNSVNYWLFQGNPKIFDFKSALADDSLNDFTVTSHKDKIQVGDKVIIWLSGDKKGCYALAEVTSTPAIQENSNDDKHWKIEDKNNLKAGIKITHNFYHQPILWNDIKDNEKFKNLKVGNQGTNFSATEEEFKTLLKLAKENNNFSRKSIFDLLRLKMENAGFKFEAEQETHGQNRKETEFKFSFPQLIKKFDQDGFDTRATKFYIKPLTDEPNCEIGFVTGKTSPLISEHIFSEPNSNDTHNDCPAWTNRDNNSAIDRLLESITNYLLNEPMKYPLNQILFGPPGTGKTYKLQSEYFVEFTQFRATTSRENYLKEEVESLDWWQVLYIALLDLGEVKVVDILSHPSVKAKARLSTINNLRASLWGALQRHTAEECPNVKVESRATIKPFWKTESSQWSINKDKELELFPEAKQILDNYNNYDETKGKEIKNYSFVTFHQSFTYEDFVEGIKPVLEDDSDELKYEISNGIFKKLALKAQDDPDNNYAIFIDEINRGNVASIFGELITLIEKDKRSGAENELSVILPYSKTRFLVPQNLYIIGTMNTADRSIEALDSALRRRFEFEEMLPNYDLIDEFLEDKNEFEGYKLSQILKTINERITVLINRDHQIGHSYFLKLISSKNIKKDLKTVFTKSIIPLLQEYFFNDYVKIAMVIGEGFLEKDKYSNVKFAQNIGDYDSDYDLNTIYEIKKDIDIDEAIKVLMGNTDG